MEGMSLQGTCIFAQWLFFQVHNPHKFMPPNIGCPASQNFPHHNIFPFTSDFTSTTLNYGVTATLKLKYEIIKHNGTLYLLICSFQIIVPFPLNSIPRSDVNQNNYYKSISTW